MDEGTKKRTCFVVMGYGEKTDFQQNKTFNLDKSYRNIIKPAATDAGFECIRADEIQHAGNINVPMYDQLLNADLVIADLSTANQNALFELGVRYALRPRTTIVIAEKGYTLPFDVGQIVVRHYEHLGSGIDYDEVERMKAELATACEAVFKSQMHDSPVYTFLKNLSPPTLEKQAEVLENAASAQQTEAALAQAQTAREREALTRPMAQMMEQAIEARDAENFDLARSILTGVRAVQGDLADPFVIHQLALATYKAKRLDPKQRLLDARDILAPLAPESSGDPETLGLWGAIHKRLSELPGLPDDERGDALDRAIWAYEKGFYLKNDHYNGINYAFLLDVRASRSTGDDAIADHVQARRVRQRVLAMCEDILSSGVPGESDASKAEQEYWTRATIVEALFGLGQRDASAARFAEAKAMTPPPQQWMTDSTQEQLAKLGAMLPAS